MMEAPSLRTSYTTQSIMSTTASEAITLSEADELQEIKSLQKIGRAALHEAKFKQALAAFEDALEIDAESIISLCGRAAVYLEMEQYIPAQHDAEKIISLDSENSQGHYLLATALGHRGNHQESLISFLRALSLEDDEQPHADMLSDNITFMAKQFASIPDEFLKHVPDLDPYTKLSEVGAFLLQNQKYELCIKVLNTAQKVETNQRGITMKVQLSLATAHSALKHTELAISLFQECLTTAIANHDPQYQTKALVSIASLFLESGDTHQAILYYEKLIHLKQELQAEDPDAPLPEYWTDALCCALHLNLSVAYKEIGNVHQAVQHANRYVTLVQGNPALGPGSEAHSHYNVGQLHVVLGGYQVALEHFKKYQTLSKAAANKRGIAQAYGALGTCYAQLNNPHMAKTYHEQHVAMARKLEDYRAAIHAHGLQGDSLVMLGELDKAIEAYTEQHRLCKRGDNKLKCAALCNIGSVYKAQRRYQYGIYYYEQARNTAEDCGFEDVNRDCQFSLASIMQHSTQMFELDQAKEFFEDLVPVFEAQIKQHEDEDTYCSPVIYDRIKECYLGMQTVLTKLGKKEECLCYSEAHKRKLLLKMSATTSKGSQSYLPDIWSIDKITRIVSEQNATILYYSVLPSSILLWVLQPGEGLVRFYSGGLVKPGDDINDSIAKMVVEIRQGRKSLIYNTENRALPLKDTELNLTRKKNKELTNVAKREKYVKELEKDVAAKEEVTEKDKLFMQKHCARKLFDMLLAPVDDVMSKLEPGSAVVVVPDRALYDLPFTVLTDWSGKRLGDKFRVSYLPNLYMLEKSVQAELNLLRTQDERDFERTQSRSGGISRVLTGFELSRTCYTSDPWPRALTSGAALPDDATTAAENVDAKRTSNPRLVTSGVNVRTPNPPPTAPPGVSRENTLLLRENTVPLSTAGSKRCTKSSKSMKTVTMASTANPSPTRQIGTSGSEKLVAAHSLSTLTTRTSTGTDITSSDCVVTEFKQISDPECCVVIGAPQLPNSVQLHGKEWHPYTELAVAQKECHTLADILEVSAIVGEQATKDTFIQSIQKATILHIATMCCLEEGYLALAPNPERPEKGAPFEHSYLVGVDDITSVSVSAKVVVLSGGLAPMERDSRPIGFKLASAFIAAGAQCVLVQLWPIPNKAMSIFYEHFYKAFNDNLYVVEAAREGMKALREDSEFSNVSYWSPFVIIGKDNKIDLPYIFHAQLDQKIDRVEKSVSDSLGKNPLNPPAVTPCVATKEENLHDLQKCMSMLLAKHNQDPHIVPALTDLLDVALKRLQTEDASRRTVTLPDVLLKNEAVVKLLKLLGFHLQARGPYIDDPYVIFPHWNKDAFLMPSYDSLRSIEDLAANQVCCRATFELLPTQQEIISYLVDVLCITKHASDIQLKVSDLSVRPLWKNARVKALLTSIGYQQVGLLLSFNNIPSNRKLLSATLQMMIAMSIHKSVILFHKLDVNLLGGPNSTYSKTSTVSFENVRLPSLTPVALPRNQIRMGTPWLSTVERPEEMEEKMRLARSKSDLMSEYKQHFERAKTWHQSSLGPLGDDMYERVGRPKTTPGKVKVAGGASASRARVPVDKEPELTIPQTGERRDNAKYLLHQRLDNVALRHRDDVKKLYLPYIQNV